MFFLRTMQAPVLVQYGDVVLSIPKFTLDDAIALGSSAQMKRDQQATEGMDEPRKREFFAFYPSIPPDITELKKLVRAFDGAVFVCKTCLAKATATNSKGEAVPMPISPDDLIKLQGAGRISSLAYVLSDLNEDISMDPNPAAATNPQTGAANSATSTTPSMPAAVTDSNASPELGKTTSASGTRPTQDSLPAAAQ